MENKNEVVKVMESPRPTMDDLNVAGMLKSQKSGLLFKSGNDVNPIFTRFLKFSKYPAQMMAYIQAKGWDKKFGMPVGDGCRLVPGDILVTYNGLVGIASVESTENEGKYLVNQIYLSNWDESNSKPYVDAELMRLSSMNRSADDDKVIISEPLDVNECCRLIAANLDSVVPKEIKMTVGYNPKSGRVEVNMGGVSYYDKPWYEKFSATMDDIRKDMRTAGVCVDLCNRSTSSEAKDASYGGMDIATL